MINDDSFVAIVQLPTDFNCSGLKDLFEPCLAEYTLPFVLAVVVLLSSCRVVSKFL